MEKLKMAEQEKKENAVRVLVVDDSVVVRSLLTRFLDADPDIKVVNTAVNGAAALTILKTLQVDVVVLDIEMPVMDGLTALPKILEIDPNIKVIMASTLTQRNAIETMRAFSLGAAECLAKPTSGESIRNGVSFQRDLVEKAKALGHSSQLKRKLKTTRSAVSNTVAKPIIALNMQSKLQVKPQAKPMITKPPSRLMTGGGRVPSILAIGSSTGGPQALLKVFAHFKGKPAPKQPIFLTQHMPATFTTILAEHIAAISGLVCAEGIDGEIVQSGHVYCAPGGYHMRVKKNGSNVVIELDKDGAAINYCKPAVDPMLDSLLTVYGSNILSVILTGMGSDGLEACKRISAAGGQVVAQDEESSVVWGMPGAVSQAGICNQILPLDDIGAFMLGALSSGMSIGRAK